MGTGGKKINWKTILDIFVRDDSNICVAAVGAFSDAAKSLISQLPSALPASAWNTISNLMDQACSAISNQEKSFDTLLQALPANAQDYNRMMTAVANIVEDYVKKNPNALAEQVMNFL